MLTYLNSISASIYINDNNSICMINILIISYKYNHLQAM